MNNDNIMNDLRIGLNNLRDAIARTHGNLDDVDVEYRMIKQLIRNMTNQQALSLKNTLDEPHDECHTMQELYEHRNALFAIAVFLMNGFGWKVYKSRKHSDGSPVEDGWFVVSLEMMEPGHFISYHLPDEYWECLRAEKRNIIPEYDGHTSQDVIKRLKHYLNRACNCEFPEAMNADS